MAVAPLDVSGPPDLDDRQQLTWGGAGWRGDVREAFQEPVERGLAIVDGGLFVVGQRDRCPHALEIVLRLDELGFAGVFRRVEVAAGAGHAVRALLEAGVGAPALAEVEVLPGLTRRGGAGGDRVAVNQDLDRADVAGEVPASS
jgi:hypothetical protein